MGGRIIRVSEAWGASKDNDKEKDKNDKQDKDDIKAKGPGSLATVNNFEVYVSGLPHLFKKDMVLEQFQPCGDIAGVKCKFDKLSHKFTGSAYIRFQTGEGMRKALELNEKEVAGRIIRVGEAWG